jgi:hypothetical protein
MRFRLFPVPGSLSTASGRTSVLAEPFSGPVVGVSPDFFAALVAWFRSVGLFGSVFPGGIVSAMAAPNQPFPYVRTTDQEAVPTETSDDLAFEVVFSCYATDPDRARVLSAVLARNVLDAAGRDRMTFRYEGRPWMEAGVRKSGTGELNGPYAVKVVPGGSDQSWRFDQPYEFLAVPAE